MTLRETVSQIGERELIRRLSPYVLTGENAGLLGVGDDCAVLREQPSGARSVLTTDLLIEGIHFLADEETSWELVGRKSAGANISDIAAMGARPVGMLISMGLPPQFPVEHVLAMYQGMQDLASQYDVPIVGGDTTRAEHVTLSITVAGVKESNRAECRRSDARPGDYIYISGNLGKSRAGLLLMLKPELRMLLGLEAWQEIIAHHFSPTPQVKLGMALAQLYPRVAMVDISDSLSNEARLIAEASGAQLEIELEAVPVHAGAANLCQHMGDDSEKFALFSGEEYELLFTLPVPPADLFEDLRHAGVECVVTHVGTVNPGNGLWLLKGGHPVDPKDETFVHFP
jgi:thiamine-monophosphate kinase